MGIKKDKKIYHIFISREVGATGAQNTHLLLDETCTSHARTSFAHVASYFSPSDVYRTVQKLTLHIQTPETSSRAPPATCHPQASMTRRLTSMAEPLRLSPAASPAPPAAPSLKEAS